LLYALNAEKAAKKAVFAGKDEWAARAGRLCALKRSFEVVRGNWCDTLARTAKAPE